MKEHREDILKIIVSAILLIAATIIDNIFTLPTIITVIMYAIPYLIAGFEVLKESAENIIGGEIFDEDFLMSIASLGAFCIGECAEAVFVMIFFNVGELFEEIASHRSRKSIAKLIDIRPDTATVIYDGNEKVVSPKDVKIGDIIIVRPGELIPLDGVIFEGQTTLDTSAITGESLPRDFAVGDTVHSGCINLSGAVRIKVTSDFSRSTVSKILELVENATEKKAKTERFIRKFAKVYTPVVVCLAVLLAVVPSIITKNPTEWIYRALMFLVVSCPCALIVSIPLTYFGGIGAASKLGVLIKGADSLEALSQVDTVVFDKTGTLTHGTFTVTSIHPNTVDERVLLRTAVAAESYSDHPISHSLKAAYVEKLDEIKVSDVKEISGLGVSAKVDGKTVLAGNDKLMKEYNIEFEYCDEVGTVVYVAEDNKYLGCIVISDTIKESSKTALSELKASGVKTVMLTGDREKAAKNVAEGLNIDSFHASLLPDQKVEYMNQIIAEKRAGKTAFVGDGINDAPVLALSDVGVAMGALGSDAAVEAADIVIMDDDIRKLPRAIKLSKRTRRIVWQNIIFSLSVKFIILLLSALGITNMWVSSFGDVGVLVLAVLNSARALRIKR